MLIRRHASGTGGGPRSRLTLTALEERVVAIIGVSAVIGQAGIQEQGFNIPSQQSEEPITEERSEIILGIQDDIHITPSPPRLPATPPLAPVTSTSCLPPPPSPRSPSRTREALSQSISPQSEIPRRRLVRARRNRGPFDRAASEFVAIEQSRLRLEEVRDRRMHEREMEGLRLESQRIEVARAHNDLLRQLSVIAQGLVQTLSRSGSLPSTVVIPDSDKTEDC